MFLLLGFVYISLYNPSYSNFLSILDSFVLINIIFTNYKSLFLLVFPCNSIPKLYLMQATYTFYIHTIQSMLILKQWLNLGSWNLQQWKIILLCLNWHDFSKDIIIILYILSIILTHSNNTIKLGCKFPSITFLKFNQLILAQVCYLSVVIFTSSNTWYHE